MDTLLAWHWFASLFPIFTLCTRHVNLESISITTGEHCFNFDRLFFTLSVFLLLPCVGLELNFLLLSSLPERGRGRSVNSLFLFHPPLSSCPSPPLSFSLPYSFFFPDSNFYVFRTQALKPFHRVRWRDDSDFKVINQGCCSRRWKKKLVRKLYWVSKRISPCYFCCDLNSRCQYLQFDEGSGRKRKWPP